MAADIPVWNPSFDVTPATLIEGIITERGLVPRQQQQHQQQPPVGMNGSNGSNNGSGGKGSGGGFAVRSWLATAAAAAAANGSSGKQESAPAAVAAVAAEGAAPEGAALPSPPGFRALDCSSIVDYVAGRPELAEHVGSPESKGSWSGERRRSWFVVFGGRCHSADLSALSLQPATEAATQQLWIDTSRVNLNLPAPCTHALCLPAVCSA